jgi:hypothetical protein
MEKVRCWIGDESEFFPLSPIAAEMLPLDRSYQRHHVALDCINRAIYIYVVE